MHYPTLPYEINAELQLTTNIQYDNLIQLELLKLNLHDAARHDMNEDREIERTSHA